MGHRARADEFSSNAKNPICIGVSQSGPSLIVMISQASMMITARVFLRSSLWCRVGSLGKDTLLCSRGRCEILVGWSSGPSSFVVLVVDHGLFAHLLHGMSSRLL